MYFINNYISEIFLISNQKKPHIYFYFFQASVICVRFFHRLKFFYYNPPPIPVETIKLNPYGVKNFRKLIDGCTFKMYGHWVKKGDNQNRAALFEHVQREDWRNQISFDNS